MTQSDQLLVPARIRRHRPRTAKGATTGTRVRVIDRGEQRIWSDRWETFCVGHGGISSHPTRAIAVSFASMPEHWCADCWRSANDPTIPNPEDAPIEFMFLVGPPIPTSELAAMQDVTPAEDNASSLTAASVRAIRGRRSG